MLHRPGAGIAVGPDLRGAILLGGNDSGRALESQEGAPVRTDIAAPQIEHAEPGIVTHLSDGIGIVALSQNPADPGPMVDRIHREAGYVALVAETNIELI